MANPGSSLYTLTVFTLLEVSVADVQGSEHTGVSTLTISHMSVGVSDWLKFQNKYTFKNVMEGSLDVHPT
jgi:hypothetical protein